MDGFNVIYQMFGGVSLRGDITADNYTVKHFAIPIINSYIFLIKLV